MNLKPSLYALLLPELREIARTHGYALALHGSLLRDLDLVCIPWVEAAEPAETLIAAFRAVLGDYAHWPPTLPPVLQHHGRLAWTILLSGSTKENYLDISVLPRNGDPLFLVN